MRNTISSLRRALFTRHRHSVDAWLGATVFFGCSSSSLLIAKALATGGLPAIHVVGLTACAAVLVNLASSFGLATLSCDPRAYGDGTPWFQGLFGRKTAEPTYRDQFFGWMTEAGRARLSAVANA